ncbi:hypothetical protein [Gloeocapsa sp. PCC 73106]|uniref:hypothetical protein n=1 Tax=Gloeocapsa sp. PCC 73106 TaxID=102232 RepID=UPI0002AC10CF|nr:hypothetical protein [Gloeocapsa sp. PCC 73106]ELR99460.1 hypothetical protein GLO73106DRAFT_00033110 [Gloeocapsa sp. PCC 73106]
MNQITKLPAFNPASAYEIPPQITAGYAVTPTHRGKVLHLHDNQVVKVRLSLPAKFGYA